MQIYPAIISKNTENMPEVYSESDYVKVRIPQFHGPKTDQPLEDYISSSLYKRVNSNRTEDKDLPWATLQRSFGEKDFLASQFNEDDVVFVMLENEDINSPIITGYANRFLYTEDPEVAQQQRESGLTIGNGYGAISMYGALGEGELRDLLTVATNEIGTKETGNNNVKYNRDYGCGNIPWCCVFVWWCFNKANLSHYFYGGKHCAYCPTLVSYYKKQGRFVTTDFKAGDIIFFDFNSNGSADHVGIAVEDQNGNTIATIEGNTSSGTKGSQSNGDGVYRRIRYVKDILGGARLGLKTATNSSSNESIIYNYITSSDGMGLCKAAACALLANISAESSFRPNLYGDKNTSYGLCQWHDTRLQDLKDYCEKNKYDYTSAAAQLSFLKYELQNKYTKVWDTLYYTKNTAEGAYNGAYTFCYYFEKPANKEKSSKSRGEAAKLYWIKYSST